MFFSYIVSFTCGRRVVFVNLGGSSWDRVPFVFIMNECGFVLMEAFIMKAVTGSCRVAVVSSTV